MFTYHKNMYIGKGVDNVPYIKKLLHEKTSVHEIFLICMEGESNSLMEIIHAREILKPLYKNKNYTVIGMADGRNEARNLTVKIITDYYNSNRDFKYFKNTF